LEAANHPLKRELKQISRQRDVLQMHWAYLASGKPEQAKKPVASKDGWKHILLEKAFVTAFTPVARSIVMNSI
jgi:hypothetical protein